MDGEPERIQFDEFLQDASRIFDRLLEQRVPVMVERDGQLFRIELEQLQAPPDIWSGYSPERVKAALRLSTGVLAGVDVEQLKRDIQEERTQESQGRPL